MTISPNSQYLAFSGMTEVFIYELPTARIVQVIPHPNLDRKRNKNPGSGWASAIAFRNDSSALYLGWQPTGGDIITCNDILTGQQTVRFYPRLNGTVHAILPKRNGSVITAGAKDPKYWDQQLNEIHSFVGHRGAVHGAAISLDERRLVTTGADGTVRMWDIETGLELLTLGKDLGRSGGMGVAFSPDGSRLAFTGSDGTLRICSAAPPPAAEAGPVPRLLTHQPPLSR